MKDSTEMNSTIVVPNGRYVLPRLCFLSAGLMRGNQEECDISGRLTTAEICRINLLKPTGCVHQQV
jgi:hypothetical protein